MGSKLTRNRRVVHFMRGFYIRPPKFCVQLCIYLSLLSVGDYTAAEASERRWWISAGEYLRSACLPARKSGFFGCCSPLSVMFCPIWNDLYAFAHVPQAAIAAPVRHIKKLRQITWLRWKQCNVRRMAAPSVPPLREWGRFEKLSEALQSCAYATSWGRRKNSTFIKSARVSANTVVR